LTFGGRPPAATYDLGDEVTGLLVLSQVRRVLLFAGLVFAALAVGSALADAAIGIGQTGTPIQANKQGTGSAQALPSGCSQAGTTVSCTFSYMGAAQGFTVPAGVGSVTVAAFGAHGWAREPQRWWAGR
jgi:hypothetical protein